MDPRAARTAHTAKGSSTRLRSASTAIHKQHPTTKRIGLVVWKSLLRPGNATAHNRKLKVQRGALHRAGPSECHDYIDVFLGKGGHNE